MSRAPKSVAPFNGCVNHRSVDSRALLFGLPLILFSDKMWFRRRKDRAEGHSWWGLHRPFDPKYRTVTSGIVQPWILFIIRLVIAIYCLVTSIVHIIVYGVQPEADYNLYSFPSTGFWPIILTILFQVLCILYKVNVCWCNGILLCRRPSYWDFCFIAPSTQEGHRIPCSVVSSSEMGKVPPISPHVAL